MHGIEFYQTGWKYNICVVVGLEDSQSAVVQDNSDWSSGGSLEAWKIISDHFHVSLLDDADFLSLGSFGNSESLDCQWINGGFSFGGFQRQTGLFVATAGLDGFSRAGLVVQSSDADTINSYYGTVGGFGFLRRKIGNRTTSSREVSSMSFWKWVRHQGPAGGWSFAQ